MSSYKARTIKADISILNATKPKTLARCIRLTQISLYKLIIANVYITVNKTLFIEGRFDWTRPLFGWINHRDLLANSLVQSPG